MLTRPLSLREVGVWLVLTRPLSLRADDLAMALSLSAAEAGVPGPTPPAPPGGGYELAEEDMSYERLLELEDVKVTATKESLETLPCIEMGPEGAGGCGEACELVGACVRAALTL